MSGFGQPSKPARNKRLPSVSVPSAVAHARQTAIAAHKSGNLSLAKQLYQGLKARDQADAACLANLALIYKNEGDLHAALECYQDAVRIQPNNASSLLNLGNLLNRLGYLNEALAHTEAALAVDPSFAAAHLNLSSILIKQLKYDQALASALEAIRLAPSLATAHVNAASVFLKLGHYDSAQEYAHKATVLDPNFAEAFQSLGTILIQRGDYSGALAQTQQALRLKPQLAEAQLNLGSILIQLERYLDALVPTRQAIALCPGMAKAHMNLACIYSKLDRHSDAIDALRESFRLEPGLAEAHCLLSDLHLRLGELDDASAAISEALRLAPSSSAYEIKAISLYDAICDFSALSSINLDQLLGKLLTDSKPGERIPGLLELTMHYLHHAHDLAGNQQYLHVAQCLSSALSEQAGSASSVSDSLAYSTRDCRQRPLRIGFLSGDFRDHVVGRFLLPLYSHINTADYKFFSYSTTESDDPFTRLFRQYSERFCDASGLTASEIHEQIRLDQIDVMIDLAGYTKGCRPELFIRRAAPIQISWLGYPASSGMQAMDYLLLDQYLLTPEVEQLMTEAPLVSNGSFLCFEQWPEWPTANSLPEERFGVLTFGTLNHPRKYTEPTLQRWAKVLQACPNSRFLFARSETSSERLRSNILRSFSNYGVAAERIAFQTTSDGSYLESYNQIDICLDTYPYTGTTTTVDTLWMGVPVVSFEGFSIHQRASAAVLHHAGCGSWIARTDEEFVAIASRLALDPVQRRHVKATMRDQLRQSILCDGALYAKNFAVMMEFLRSKLADL